MAKTRTWFASIIGLLLACALLLAACGRSGATAPVAQSLETSTARPASTATPVTLPTEQPKPTRLSDEARLVEQQVAQMLRQQLHLDDEQVTVVGVEEVAWPDACLGVRVAGVVCAQVVTPGYRVVLQANGQRYEYHTDLSGDQVVLASAPGVEVPDAAVVWTKEGDDTCQTAILGSDVVAFGACGGALMGGRYATPERSEAFAHFLQAYAPFEAQTPAGRVTFTGQGSSTAKPAEQRMIAEWARLAALEAASGRSDRANGLALSWRREGGATDLCDDVTVYLAGEAYVSECKDGQLHTVDRDRLTVPQLRQLYAESVSRLGLGDRGNAPYRESLLSY